MVYSIPLLSSFCLCCSANWFPTLTVFRKAFFPSAALRLGFVQCRLVAKYVTPPLHLEGGLFPYSDNSSFIFLAQESLTDNGRSGALSSNAHDWFLFSLGYVMTLSAPSVVPVSQKLSSFICGRFVCFSLVCTSRSCWFQKICMASISCSYLSRFCCSIFGTIAIWLRKSLSCEYSFSSLS